MACSSQLHLLNGRVSRTNYTVSANNIAKRISVYLPRTITNLYDFEEICLIFFVGHVTEQLGPFYFGGNGFGHSGGYGHTALGLWSDPYLNTVW